MRERMSPLVARLFVLARAPYRRARARCKIGKLCGTAAIPSRAVPCIIGMVRQKLPVRPFRRFRSAKVNSCCLE